MSCVDCKKGLLNQDKSSLGIPKCDGDCPEDIGCPFMVFTNCILYNGPALNCLGISSGDSANDIFEALEIFCQNTSNSGNNCRVKIDADDTCCGYLKDKISSSTLDVEVSGETCKTLTINEKDWTWVNITNLQTPWKNLKTVQPSAATLQYGYKNDEVRLKGQVYLTNTVGVPIPNLTTAPLPVGVRPSERKVFTTLYTSGVDVLVVNITIQTTGVISVEVLFPVLVSVDSDLIISLDFINYVK